MASVTRWPERMLSWTRPRKPDVGRNRNPARTAGAAVIINFEFFQLTSPLGARRPRGFCGALKVGRFRGAPCGCQQHQ